jgi:hypothetical protein
MDLFSTGLDENQNLCLQRQKVFYYGHMMPIQDIILSGKFTETIPWKNDEAVILVNSLYQRRVIWRYQLYLF